MMIVKSSPTVATRISEKFSVDIDVKAYDCTVMPIKSFTVCYLWLQYVI